VKRSVIAFMSLVALAGSAWGAQATGPLKIGVVNIQRLMQEAPQMQTATQALQAEFGAEEREIIALGATLKAREEKLVKDQATMSQSQFSSAERELSEGYIDLEAKQRKVQEKLNTRRNEELGKLQRLVLEEVQKYASANTYDLILADGVLFAANALDVTAPILDALKARRPAAAPAAAPAPARPATP
jgi:outer membrane protein